MKTTPIYKIGNQYLLSRENLFNKIKQEIDSFFINRLRSSIEMEGDFPFESLETDVANIQNIGSVTIPVHDFMIVDQNNQSIDRDVKILIDLSLNIQEGIIDEMSNKINAINIVLDTELNTKEPDFNVYTESEDQNKLYRTLERLCKELASLHTQGIRLTPQNLVHGTQQALLYDWSKQEMKPNTRKVLGKEIRF